jgi:hypothetical protein
LIEQTNKGLAKDKSLVPAMKGCPPKIARLCLWGFPIIFADYCRVPTALQAGGSRGADLVAVIVLVLFVSSFAPHAEICALAEM